MIIINIKIAWIAINISSLRNDCDRQAMPFNKHLRKSLYESLFQIELISADRCIMAALISDGRRI